MTLSQGLDFATIENALVLTVEDAAGVPCIWGRDEGPQPTLPYVAIDWLQPPTRIGEDDTEAATASGSMINRSYRGPRAATISVHAFSESTKPTDSAMHYASIVQTALGLQGYRDSFLTPGGVGVLSVGAMQNATAPRDGTRKQVSHVVFDVDINLASNIEQGDSVAYVLSATVTGTVDDVSRGAMTVPE